MKRLAKCLLPAVAMLVPAVAHADPTGTGNMRITAIVPMVCNIDTDSFSLNPLDGLGQADAQGTVREFCNSSQGFMVMASYRPLEAGEQVTVSYDGQTSALNASGMSSVAFRQGPRLRTVPVSIHSTGLHSGIAVSLGMTAI
jgi:hypothetical protein